MTTTTRPQCEFCKRWRDDLIGTGTCEAFPGGIPFEVYSGQVSHRKAVDGDHGVRFEITDDPAKIAAYIVGTR